jgi:predicted PurR-regulated permease PerM
LNPFRGTRAERLDTLVSLAILVGILAATLAVLFLLAEIIGVLRQYKHVVFLFVAGAILAYLLAPMVRSLQVVVRKRWLAILSSYLVLFIALAILGVLLINPFISQARSLKDNLANPAVSSLRNFNAFKVQASHLETAVARQQSDLSAGSIPSDAAVTATETQIATLQRGLAALQSSAQPPGQIRIPPSYLQPFNVPLARLASEYPQAFPGGGAAVVNQLSHAATDAKTTARDAATAYSNAVSSPLLLLNLQLWLDQHGVNVNLHDKFGQALQDLSKQVANIVNNALSLALQAGNLLLDTVLILIISIYFLSDGERFVRWLVSLTPSSNRPRAAYFVHSLDSILGRYLRVQVLLALLAATLDAIGAVVLGIPYAVVIFLSSFFLSLVPVIGPVVLPFPPLIISLIFTPLPRPAFFALWLLSGEQLTTNVIGPRLQGHRLGIHPLEAMAAALIGFPLAGILGSFLAIPFVAFLHVVARSFAETRESLPPPMSLPGGPDPPAPAA